MKQYYVRDGRRFVKANSPQVVDQSGKYYQTDGTFSSEKNKNSIGFCIQTTIIGHDVMLLKPYNATTSNANSFLERGWRIPTSWELDLAFRLWKDQISLLRGKNYICRIVCGSGGSAYYGAHCGLFYFAVVNASSAVYAALGGSGLLHPIKTIPFNL